MTAQQLILSPASRHAQLEREAVRFHAAHPLVWTLFERFALEKARTHRHYSADAIMHRVRWETDAGSADAPKINNNLVSFYARRFARLHPDRAGFFRFREQGSRSREAR